MLSDGELLPCEMVRRAQVRGYRAIALTDHVDMSNIDFVVPRLARACDRINKYWDITAIPGCEITHAPLEEIEPLVKFARKSGAKIILVHGETTAEPVIPGTNRAAIEAGCDILAHPGYISEKDAKLAARWGVYLEITSRRGHCRTNRWVFEASIKAGAKILQNNDAHSDSDLISMGESGRLLRSAGATPKHIKGIYNNSLLLLRSLLKLRIGKKKS